MITKTILLETERSIINKIVKITEKAALIPNKSVLCLLCLCICDNRLNNERILLFIKVSLSDLGM